MRNKVGLKGQVVIEKAIRDRLGIEPGWRTVRFFVDGYVEIHFIPPDHNRSLAGCLAPYIKPVPGADHESTWDDAVARGMSEDYLVKEDDNKTHIVSPEHNRSLKGTAEPYIRRRPERDEDWDYAIGESMAEEFARSKS